MKTKSSQTSARFAYEGLDRVIHERARLSVLHDVDVPLCGPDGAAAPVAAGSPS